MLQFGLRDDLHRPAVPPVEQFVDVDATGESAFADYRLAVHKDQRVKQEESVNLYECDSTRSNSPENAKLPIRYEEL